MKLLTGLLIALLSFCAVADEPLGAMAGVELGGNGTLLTGSPPQAFGMGIGYQGSAFFSLWTNRFLTGKIRYELIRMSEVALSSNATDEIQAGTKLRSAVQNYRVLSVGVEKTFEAHAQKWFWEAMLSYAMGADGQVTVAASQADQAPVETSQSTRSNLALSGGVGLIKPMGKSVVGLMTVRTMFMLGRPYNDLDKYYLLFPLIFNVGVAVPFSF